MSLTIRQAETEEDREQVFRFRYEIYVNEMGKPMPGADHARQLLRDKCDEKATHLMAIDRGRLAGSLRMIWGGVQAPDAYVQWYGLKEFSEFASAQLSFTGRLMVQPGLRSGLTASALACEAFQLAFAKGVKLDFIHTTPPLVRFFERLGHRRYRENFVDPDLGLRIPMMLVLEDAEHLMRCRSPFLRRAQATVLAGGMSGWFAERFSHFTSQEVFA